MIMTKLPSTWVLQSLLQEGVACRDIHPYEADYSLVIYI